MFIAIIVIHVLVCIILIAVILLQAGKGSGLSEMLGGGGGQEPVIFGARAGTFLTRATAICAALFFITCLSLAILSGQRGKSLMELERIKLQEKEAKELRQKVEDRKKAEGVQENMQSGEGEVKESGETTGNKENKEAGVENLTGNVEGNKKLLQNVEEKKAGIEGKVGDEESEVVNEGVN